MEVEAAGQLDLAGFVDMVYKVHFAHTLIDESDGGHGKSLLNCFDLYSVYHNEREKQRLFRRIQP